jgi:hypothetical protein
MVYLVSFADSRMQRSLDRLVRQAKSMDIFDDIYMLIENDLPTDFKEYFKDKLIPGSRGYGYWSWKPEVILSVLNKIQEEDYLLYIDAGCHLNNRGKQRLLEYFKILKHQETGIVAFQAIQPSEGNSSLVYDGRKLFDQPNYSWIKGDLFDYFGVKDNPSVVNDQIIGAGIILIRKCDRAINIIREWQKIIWHHFNLLDDTPSVSPNFLGFIEHRHDQAIWTLLCLKHRVKTLSAYEYWYPMNNTKKLKPDWFALEEFPIHAKRDKDLGILKNNLSRVKKLITRFLGGLQKMLRKL